jgi:glucose/arabinose dehydrogenase
LIVRSIVAFVACSILLTGALIAGQTQRQYPYPPVRDQRGAIPPGPRVEPWNSPALGDGPFLFDSYEQRGLRAVVVTKGLSHPWSLAFLPDGSMLITERQGRLRIVRDGKLDPAPVAGIPAVTSLGTMAGLMDIALHPKFAQNKWVYISYHKPMGTAKSVEGRDAPIASNSILRGTWDGKALTDVRDIFVADDIDMEASRITFGPDGMLYMGIGGPGTGSKISMDRAQGTNDLAGKILRMTDEGKVPPDNPFVGKSGYKPYIFSLGHRVQLGLAFNPYTNELWETENGPNGGDELNIVRGQKLRLADRQLRPRLQRPAIQSDAPGNGRPSCVLGAVDRDVRLDLLHRRQIPRLVAQRLRRRHARG